ncbi:aldo/keto reductase [Bacillus sp. S2(2019)]|uniref:aldo/keto reductase n=1 Tax=unclassified Bacillus (in: firmicutes) TaxID=185979 RepID=UPI0010AE99DB|nr:MULTISPECIES: aldo/keto reductase [unclassified Bacillus (in: firmicutes)]TKD56628.1 aldo/keto reductase [Bacillus sp. S2(2019)]
MNDLQSTKTLNNGVRMPGFGLGVFQVEEGTELIEAVKTAIQLGYRSIDTASIYGNEEGVGRGIQLGLAETGLRREDIFVTSKVWNADLGYEATLKAYEDSLKKLQLDYLDLYLIHWPVEGKYKEAWRALETLYREGKVRAIGVSNFQPHHLDELLTDADIIPAINQVEFHPKLTQETLFTYLKTHGIQMEAWSPLMQGELLHHPLITELAGTYSKTPAQIILRWDVQKGVITIPKSTKAHRLQENADIFDFVLSDEDMKRLSDLNENKRIGPDPDNFDF